MENKKSSFYSERNSPMKISYLERRWKQILEEERTSYARNKKLLEDFDQVEEQMAIFSGRNDSLKHAKQAFESYVKTVYPKWQKELKRLRERKERNLNKVSNNGIPPTREDFLKETKHSSNSLGNSIPIQITNPTLSSTLFTSSTHNQHTEPRLSHLTRNDQSGYYGNSLPYHPGQYPMSHPMVDYGTSWYQGPQFGTYGLPSHHLARQPYGQPWLNASFERHPGYMTDTIHSHHSGTGDSGDRRVNGDSNGYHMRVGDSHKYHMQMRDIGGYETSRDYGRGNPRSRDSERQGREHGVNDGSYARVEEKLLDSPNSFIGNISEERFREFEKWEKSVYGQGQDGGHSQEHRKEPTVDTSELSYGKKRDETDRNARHQTLAQRNNFPSKDVQAKSDKTPEIKCSSGVKDILGSDQLSPEVIVKEPLIAEQSNNTSKETSSKAFDRSAGNVSTKKNKPKVEKDCELADLRREIEQSESRSNGVVATSSVSLPSFHNVDGNLKDYCSSDTDQILEQIESNSIARQEINLETNRGTDVGLKESSTRKSDAEIVGDIGSRLKERADHSLPSEVSDVGVKGLSSATSPAGTDGEVGGMKVVPKTMGDGNSVDDVLGETFSDYEMSHVSDIGEEADESDLELSKSLPHETSPTRSTGVSEKQEVKVEGRAVDTSDGGPRVATSKEGLTNEAPDEGTMSREKVQDEELDDTGNVSEREPSKSTETDVSPGIDHHKQGTQVDTASQDLSVSEKSFQTGRSEKAAEESVISVDEDTLLCLLRVVDDDIEVSFNTELLYRHDTSIAEKKQEIIRSAKANERLERYDPAVVSMVVMDQLPHVVQSLNKSCLISEQIIANEKKYLREKDIRGVIDGSFKILWKHLYSHFVKIIEYSVMQPRETAEIFAPRLAPGETSSTDKAVGLLARIISSSQEDYLDNTESMNEIPSSQHQDDQSEKNKSDGLDELSFSSDESPSEHAINRKDRSKSKNKSASKADQSYSEDIKEEKSIPLTETDAYRKMLNSLKTNDDDDVDDDIEEDLELTMSEANTSGPLKHSLGHQPSPHQIITDNKAKLPLFGGQEVDGSPEQVFDASWKSSEASSPPLTPDLATSGYVPSIAGKKDKAENKTPDAGKEGLNKNEKSGKQNTDTKSRIKSGFWNHSDSESDVDFQASHGTNVKNDDDDDFDFYS